MTDLSQDDLAPEEYPFPEEPPWNNETWEYDPDLPHTWPGDEKARWQITDDRVADWAMAKYARAEWEIDRLTKLAEFQIEGIRQRLAAAIRTPEHDVDFFGSHLTAYHKRMLDSGLAQGASYKLLNGDLTSRKLPAKVYVEDVDLVYDFDETLTRIKVEPDKPKILARLKAGESIPGCELVDGDTSFKPKPGTHEQPAFLPMPESEERAA